MIDDSSDMLLRVYFERLYSCFVLSTLMSSGNAGRQFDDA